MVELRQPCACCQFLPETCRSLLNSQYWFFPSLGSKGTISAALAKFSTFLRCDPGNTAVKLRKWECLLCACVCPTSAHVGNRNRIQNLKCWRAVTSGPSAIPVYSVQYHLEEPTNAAALGEPQELNEEMDSHTHWRPWPVHAAMHVCFDVCEKPVCRSEFPAV